VNIQADTPSLLYADEFLEDDPEYIVVIMHGTSLFLLYLLMMHATQIDILP
jgi:hypothetical protein